MAKHTRQVSNTGLHSDVTLKRARRASGPRGKSIQREMENELYNKEVKDDDEKDSSQSKNKRGRLLKESSTAVELRRSKRLRTGGLKEEDIKKEDDEGRIDAIPSSKTGGSRISSKAKAETGTDENQKTNSKDSTVASLQLQAKKLKSYTQYAATHQSPFPAFPHPTASECRKAHDILAALHGTPTRAEPEPTAVSGGCGNAHTVLEALTETILSQNTTSRNSTAAKHALDDVYGRNNWAAIASGGPAKLAHAIAGGGLAGVKSAVIHTLLAQIYARHGAYSLEHLRDMRDHDAMRELLAFRGVGPKTASCVLLFCLRRASFAVDTHVYRIAALLGWRPQGASREETHAHLEARVPDAEKFGLHVLMVRHGRVCAECRARGKKMGRCELLRAFGGEGDGGRGDDDDDDDAVQESV